MEVGSAVERRMWYNKPVEGYAVPRFGCIQKRVIMTADRSTNLQSGSVMQEKRPYSVQEIADILQISKSKAYALCKESCFKTVKVGKYVRISRASFDAWLDRTE